MKITKLYRAALFGLLALAILSQPAVGKGKKPETIAEISGVARAGSEATVVQVFIFKWTTDAERETARKKLDEGGNTGLYDYFHGLDEIGRLRIPGHMEAELKYAYRTESNGKQVIVLASDRPIGFGETADNLRSSRYILTLIQFEIDAETNKKGEGRIMAGARFVHDEKENRMVPEAYAGQPILVGSVSYKEPKHK